MEVTGEVQVDAFHGHDLGVTATGGATLHPEDGPQGWFTQCDHGLGTHEVQRVGQPDGDGGFSFNGRGGRSTGDQHELSAFASLFNCLGINFGHLVDVGDECVVIVVNCCGGYG